MSFWKKLASFSYAGLTLYHGVSACVDLEVPTGTPIPGDYKGEQRPQVHFSPPRHFMNDPNGLFLDAAGTWHLYYQFNPTGLAVGNQHWGHATSKDLYHWVNQPIALFPPEETAYVFSGSAIVDVNNTSGFFPFQNNGVVAIFTLARIHGDGSAGPQTQNIAYSCDGGFTFEYYVGNPVIDSMSSHFRDPKVIWDEDHWVMVVAFAQDFVVGIYTSTDLKKWTHASNFSHHGLLGTQYECPNLVKMPVRDAISGSVVGVAYVMTISIQSGAPLGGSVTQYFPGDFNGTHFMPWDGATRLTDFAKDNYAAQFFYGVPDGSNAVSLGWASNWQYAQQVPTGVLEGWRGIMTLPRSNYITNATRASWVMVDEIYDLAPVLDTPLKNSTWRGNDAFTSDSSAVASSAVYLDVNVTGLDTSSLHPMTSLTLTLASATSGEALLSGFYFDDDATFFVDRSQTNGFKNIFFTDKFSIADVWNKTAGSWRMQAVFDRSIFEVFVDDGVHAATILFFSMEPLTRITVRTTAMPARTTVSAVVWGLRSAWADLEDETGKVYGNVTSMENISTVRQHMRYEAQF